MAILDVPIQLPDHVPRNGHDDSATFILATVISATGKGTTAQLHPSETRAGRRSPVVTFPAPVPSA